MMNPNCKFCSNHSCASECKYTYTSHVKLSDLDLPCQFFGTYIHPTHHVIYLFYTYTKIEEL
jgi:hypothetical protein